MSAGDALREAMTCAADQLSQLSIELHRAAEVLRGGLGVAVKAPSDVFSEAEVARALAATIAGLAIRFSEQLGKVVGLAEAVNLDSAHDQEG